MDFISSPPGMWIEMGGIRDETNFEPCQRCMQYNRRHIKYHHNRIYP